MASGIVTIRERPAELNLRKLDRTSPTVNDSLRSCELKVAFQRDTRFRPVASTTSAALGTSTHKLLEATSKGNFDRYRDKELEEQIDQYWDHLVTEEHKKLQEVSMATVPRPTSWKKYSMNASNAFSTALRIVESRNAREQINHAVKVSPEVTLSGFEGKLTGQIDLLIITQSRIAILDYKTGRVLENSEDVSHAIKEQYVRQLSIYAALYYEEIGTWPTHLVLESMVDGRHEWEVDPVFAKQSAADAITRMEKFNENISRNKVKSDPSEHNCIWCDYKAVCNSFLHEASSEWEMTSVTVSGVLVESTIENKSHVLISSDGGNHEKTELEIRGLPIEMGRALQKELGKKVSFSNLTRIHGSMDLWFHWNSMCWIW